MSEYKNALALVLGGYINGYSIIRELKESGVENIWLFDFNMCLASKSNKINGFTIIEQNPESLKAEIEALKNNFEKIVIYPTDDLQLEFLHEIYEDISDYCFVPFNQQNIIKSLDKMYQYECCERLGIPYPNTTEIASINDLKMLKNFEYPILIKPNKRDDLTTSVFRSLLLKNSHDLYRNEDTLGKFLQSGVTFLASELIPGDDTHIYAYTGYRSKKGEILNDWIGKKLTQHPNVFGVFSSASNKAPDIIRDQGQALLNGMDLMGIVEPEFKYDVRDGRYKLMEINLRSMMWHRMGNLSGVKLQYTQWLDATDQITPFSQQEKDVNIHFVYMKHEIDNLLSRKGYFKHFLYNIFGGEQRHFAVFNKKDLKPFFYDLTSMPRSLVYVWLKALKMRS